MGGIRVIKFVIAGGLVAAGLAGGAAAASDYPPDVPPQSTVLVSTQEPPADAGSVVPLRAEGQLPETGTDAMAIATVAGGALVAGVGLVAVARRRRRPAPA